MQPGWLIELITLLADGRITREIEEWVYHELPFTRALCYRHGILMRDPHVWTLAAHDPAVSAAVVEQVEAVIASIPVDADE